MIQQTKIRLVIAAFFLLVGVHAAAADVTNGLAGWWKLDDSGGAIDSSGQGNDGTLTGTEFVNDCKRGGCRRFYAIWGDVISINNNATLRPTNITVSAWINQTSVSTGYPTIAGHYSPAAGDFAYKLDTSHDGDKLRGYVYYNNGTSNAWVQDSTTIVNGIWYHLALTYDGTTAILYKDGVSIGNSAGGGNMNIDQNQPMSIGAAISPGGVSNTFNGLIDDVRIYNRALSAVEVQAIYLAGTPRVSINGRAHLVGFHVK